MWVECEIRQRVMYFQNTIDESSIVAGCGIHDTVHSLPVPAARNFKGNKDGEVDMSSDEYGAHTYQKKVSDRTGCD